MFFSPNKRSESWYHLMMVCLYSLHLAFGVLAIIAIILSDDKGLLDKIILTAIFLVASVICWALGKRCSNALPNSNHDHRSNIIKILRNMY
jgi:4-hydroxybenzoate polyprenyltransferase